MSHLEVRLVDCKTAASRSKLPGLDWALNPYRGCSHACSYCYAQDVTRFELARPWGSVVEVKANIVTMLRKELARGPRGVYGIGTVTDPYQPLESKHGLTRGCLALLKGKGARISVLTKSDLVLRDLDILRGWKGAEVGLSIGCVDEQVAPVIEPGAPPPRRRLKALSELSSAGVEVYLMAAPIIPGLSDGEEMIVELVSSAHDAGVKRIMWDKWNPKPVASTRLSLALAELDGGVPQGVPAGRLESMRRVLVRECASRDIELVSGF